MIRSRADAVVCVLRDATEMSHLRAQLVFADRMVAMGTLAAGVAHEINNPLTYVLGNAVFIQRLLERPEEIERRRGEAITMLDGILEGANHIRTIVQDLRSLARPDQGARAFLDVQRSLTSAINLVMPQIRPRARLSTSFEPAPLIMASEARLGQVFLNLLLNAAQAIPEGASEQNSIRVSLRNEGRSIRVTIADTGSGLTPDVRDRIFEAFFTTKSAEEGTGLGLFISNNIVTSMGGTITVEELTEGGCAFHVILPADEDPAGAPAKAPDVAPRRASAGERARILLVDDEPMVLQVMARMLAPHEVVQVSEGGDALSRLLTEPAFDVVLCDMMMPGVSGMDVFAAAVARWPALRERFVFLTGAVYSDAARAFVTSITNLVMEKPVDEDALLAAVDGVVARAGRAAAGG
jgi:nitrogen-specific signal transduction histidine kinase/CheY-like chemotaxis protein